MSENIEYRHNYPLDPVEVARVFDASGIMRPTTDLPRIARMFSAPSLVLSAWQGGLLVGVSRSLTDYSYCCYLSDLAVDKALQGKGIGRELIRRTQAIIGDEVSLILLSSPGAMSLPGGWLSASRKRLRHQAQEVTLTVQCSGPARETTQAGDFGR